MKYQTKSIYKPILTLIDLIGNIIYFNRDKTLLKKPTKVLFFSLSHIGDLILATPTFETFKRNNNCQVDVLCRSVSSSLLECNPFVNNTFTFDAPWLSCTYKSKGKAQKEIVKLLKAQKYDIVFEMHGHPKSLYLAHQLNSFVIGYGCRGGGFYCNKMKNFDSNMKTLNQNLYLIGDYWTRMYDQPQLFTPSYNLQLPSSFIIINPKSGKKEKDLTKEEVEKIINDNSSETILITGLDKDNRFDKFPNVQNWTGKTSLKELIDIVRKAKIVYADGMAPVAKK